jgi:hypothetical protein
MQPVNDNSVDAVLDKGTLDSILVQFCINAQCGDYSM